MKLKLINLTMLIVITLIAFTTRTSILHAEEKVNSKNKLDELVLNGMIQKYKNTYFLKMGDEQIKLPDGKHNALTVKVEDFEDKMVTLKAEGVVRYSKTGVKSHIIKRINEIKLADDSAKKEEKKEEPKKEEPKTDK